MPYKCLIIDDEPPAIDLLRKHLSLVDDIEIAGECLSAVKAFELLRKQDIDLIFLDIQMPVLTGLDFLNSIQNSPKVIITTAYREYAIDGYDLDVIDYLLKPISFQRFMKSVERFFLQANPVSGKFVAPSTAENPEYFFVNINKKLHKIVFADIIYIESLKDYVRIHTTKKPLVVKGNIGAILTQLPPHLFIRTHRSYVVSLHKITAFTSRDIEIDQIKIPIGASYKIVVDKRLRG